MITLLRPCLLALAAVTFAAACTVQETQVPPLTGPSEFALAVSVAVTPDTLNRDGASQSSILLTTRGPDGAPAGGVPLRLDMVVGGVLQDFGALSARNLVTGSDGRASAVYTAPPAPPPGVAVPITTLTILATTSGSNAQTAVSHSADIRLVPVGVILPPAQSAGPRFTFSPSDPQAHSAVQFDASASCAGPVDPTSTDPCPSGHGAIVDYRWTFGDGSTAQGSVVSHTFASPRTYGVTLTVTNDRGGSGSLTQAVSVAGGEAPTADFVFSPTSPNVGQLVQFNASASRAAPGRAIVEYIWNWGDGEEDEGMLDEHDYFEAGVYTVTLTVVDDVGQQGTVAKTVTVASGSPTAAFTISPQPPVSTGTQLTFNGSTSTVVSGASIVSYTWVFGDGSGSGPNAVPTATKTYGAANTYTVTLTVTDSAGRTATVSQAVTIQ